MKGTFVVLSAALLQVATAQPHHHHAHMHEKRLPATHTQVVTMTAADVVVYVDEAGKPYSTGMAVETPAPAAQPALPAALPPPLPAPARAPAGPAAPVDDGPSLPVDANSRYATVAAGVSKRDNYGISWTPFNGEETDVTCKSQDQSNGEFEKIARMQFTDVRIYGVDCNQVAIAMTAAAASGIKLMLGIWNIDNAANEANDMVRQMKAAGQDWDMVTGISVGNEDVEKGRSPDQVINAVNAARGVLRAAGYQGPIVHVDTVGAFLANPVLCSEKAGDFIAANVHPFFNSGTMPHQAGKFVTGQVAMLRQCSAQQSRKRRDHRVVVAETGWPSGGNVNGKAIPGRLQQFAAILSIKQAMPKDVYLYSAFDNRWLKDNAGTFGAEKHWGLLDQ